MEKFTTVVREGNRAVPILHMYKNKTTDTPATPQQLPTTTDSNGQFQLKLPPTPPQDYH